MKTMLLTLAASLGLSAGAFARDRAVSFDQHGDLAAFRDGRLTAPETGGPSPSNPGLCVFSGVGGSALGAQAFEAAIRASDVVCVGETHDQANDHLAQLEALKALYGARGQKTAVGFEMLNLTLQPVLDDYAALVVAGTGHIIYNAGIPASVLARAPGARVLSFFTQGAQACPAALPGPDLGLADYVWYVEHAGAPAENK